MIRYVGALMSSTNRRVDALAPHNVAKLVLPLAFAMTFGAGYFVGEMGSLAELTGIEPRQSVYLELTHIRDEISEPDARLTDYEAEARHLHAAATKYATRIKYRDQFTLRKKRRTCLFDAVADLDGSIGSWRNLNACGKDTQCVAQTQPVLSKTKQTALNKIGECVTLFERKQE